MGRPRGQISWSNLKTEPEKRRQSFAKHRVLGFYTVKYFNNENENLKFCKCQWKMQSSFHPSMYNLGASIKGLLYSAHISLYKWIIISTKKSILASLWRFWAYVRMIIERQTHCKILPITAGITTAKPKSSSTENPHTLCNSAAAHHCHYNYRCLPAFILSDLWIKAQGWICISAS